MSSQLSSVPVHLGARSIGIDVGWSRGYLGGWPLRRQPARRVGQFVAVELDAAIGVGSCVLPTVG
jgi:hypothetical protein